MNLILYKIERSRNKGVDWSHLMKYDNYNYNAIKSFFDEEVKNHPSDWLRIVKCEEVAVVEHLGNARKGNKRQA